MISLRVGYILSSNNYFSERRLVVYSFFKKFPSHYDALTPQGLTWPGRDSSSQGQLILNTNLPGTCLSSANQPTPNPCPQPPPLSNSHPPSQDFPCPKSTQGHVPDDQRPPLQLKAQQHYSNEHYYTIHLPCCAFPWENTINALGHVFPSFLLSSD